MTSRVRAIDPEAAGASETTPTVGTALDRTAAALRDRCGRWARAEALALLAGVLELSSTRTWLERERRLSGSEDRLLRARAARRAAGEPIEYIEGRCDFRELTLRVCPAVLIPRPETEVLVERVLEWSRGRSGLLGLDLGTGSGAIALSLVMEGPFAHMVGVDISAAALNVAQANAAAVGALDRVELRDAPFFESVDPSERFDLIVSNPPYVASSEFASLPAEVRDFEPTVALLSGPSGLEVVEAVIREAPMYLKRGGLLALEVASDRAEAVLDRIRACGAYHEPRVYPDLAGRPRVILTEAVGDPEGSEAVKA